MAVVPRKRKRGVVYGVLTSLPGGGEHWELVGKNRREAEQVDARRKAEVKAGTFRPGELTDAASVRSYAERWMEGRKNRSADNDRALMARHVLSVPSFASLRMADVRPRHVLALVEELGRGTLSPKSVSLVMGLVRVMFRDAVIGDVIAATPYVVPRGILKRSGEKRAPYTATEARALMAEPVGERERAWNALAFYTGARCGEVSGLRWGDWDEAPVPLGSLSIERQYGGQVLKTERPRVVPVHPALARLLAAWRDRWSLYFLRRPEPADLICPRMMGTDIEPLTKNAAYKAWIRSCTAAGVQNRSIHSTRHTFITLARRGGADKEAVELVTHNPKGTIIDRYTTRDWAQLCEVVMALPFDGPLDAGSNGGGNSGSRAWTRTSETGEATEETTKTVEAVGGFAPSILGAKSATGAPLDARQTGATPAAWSLALAADSALSRPGRTYLVKRYRTRKARRRVG